MTATATRKGRPSPEDSRQKLADVMAAAREEFIRRGYRGVTMRGVAERACVSTRTLYNHYPDKLSLFAACLDFGATAFPRIEVEVSTSPADALHRYAVSLIRMLSEHSSLTLGMLVYREGQDFPELVAAAEANQDRHIVAPLAAYLSAVGLAEGDARERARLFNLMALSEWQRSVLFGHPMPQGTAIERHADLVVHLFLHGASALMERMGHQRAVAS